MREGGGEGRRELESVREGGGMREGENVERRTLNVEL
jgi:hypothetical protein